jgi:hypothetical protein
MATSRPVYTDNGTVEEDESDNPVSGTLGKLIRNAVKEEFKGMAATMSTARPSSSTTGYFGTSERLVSGGGEEEGSSVTDWVMAVGGLMVFLYVMNRVINYVYFRAVSNIDLANRHGAFYIYGIAFWRMIEIVLRHLWPPLWFTHNEMYHQAIRTNLDQEYQRVRLQNMIDQGSPVPVVRFRDMLHGNFVEDRREQQRGGEDHGQCVQRQDVQLPRRIVGQGPLQSILRQTIIRHNINDENRVDRNQQQEVGRDIEPTDEGYEGYERPRVRVYEDSPAPVRRVVEDPDQVGR